jgi:hypothetical protein
VLVTLLYEMQRRNVQYGLECICGADGESHFEDVEIPFEENLGPSLLTKPMAAKDVFFIENSGEHEGAWHTAPCRLMIVITRGELKIETGDGSTRRFGPDDILIAEDTTGRGHLSRARDRKAIVVRLS